MLKTYGVLIASLTMLTQTAADNIGIIGGLDLTGTGPAYAALVTSSDQLTPLTLTGNAALGGIISSVSMNFSQVGLIGGQGLTGTAYAALVSATGEITPLTFSASMAAHGVINSVAINNSGNGIIGGKDNFGPIYAALVPASGNPLTPLTFPPIVAAGGIINSVAINNSGNSLVGGQVQSGSIPAYAASVSPDGTVTTLALTGGIATSGSIASVTINASGNGLIGGQDQTGSKPAYAALVSSLGRVTPLTLTGGGIATSGEITSVSINGSGNGIIGGQDQTGSTPPAYAALVSSSGSVTPLTLTGGMTTNGIVNTVAINAFGNGILGGQDFTGSQPAYAALVSPSGSVTPLALTGGGIATSGEILSVAIDASGNGILGGQDQTGSQPAYAALFTSSGAVIPLTFTGGMATSGWIDSVALPRSLMEIILPLFHFIPTGSLSGNNLSFAKYINEFAPEDAFYFIPSNLDGTLNAALQSAAPTRNGISTYTASSNLFFLTTSFANHLRNQHTVQRTEPTTITQNALPYDELLTSLSLQNKPTPSHQDKPFTLWFEAIGAWAHQKPQHQTVGFDPTTGGAILAFDDQVTPHWLVGGGITYLYTHIHERKDQGHTNINQEEAFVYSSWDNQRFYVDMLVMGGAMQIHQARNTKMTGFSFHSFSHPHGWQLLPHLELGSKLFKTSHFYLNPFVMLDWANAWQESYTEKGDSPFNASQKSFYGSLLRTEAGLRFYETLFFDSWNLTFQEKISYVNTQSYNAGKVRAFLVGAPGSFTVETLSSAVNLGVAQLAMSFAPLYSHFPITTLLYQGEFSEKYQSHQINLDLAWQF